MAWMLPVAIALSAGANIYGASQQDKANKRTNKQVTDRNQMAQDLILPLLQGGGGSGAGSEAINGLSDWLQNFDFNKPFASNQAWNSGQDAWMQMLRADPYDNTDLFKSWEPIEKRTLDNSLAGAFAGAAGLGQRFGSAMMREEGRVRGEAADNAAARRQTAEATAYENTMGRKVNAAQGLGNMGSVAAQLIVGMLGQQLQGYGTLGNLGAQGSNDRAQLLALLLGQPFTPQSPSAIPGAASESFNMLALLPMLMNLSRGN